MTERNYLKEMQEHYAQVMSAGTGEKKKVSMSFCPTTWNKPCKLCDSCKEILFHQDRQTAQKIEQAREINRKPKFYANVVLPSNPSEVLLFEYGKTIGDKLGIYEMDNNSDLKGFINPKSGRNMIIVRYPNADKRKTRYDVEPRIIASSIADMSILDKLYNLDDVPALLTAGIQPLYQSKLTAQRTELRWLPFWDWRNHPELASVFQVKYFIHYHTSEDELAAINRGELTPLLDEASAVTPMLPRAIVPPSVIPPTAPSTWIPQAPVIAQAPIAKATTLWDDLQAEASVRPVDAPTPTAKRGARPGCFGTYDDGEPVCIKRCAEQGWLEECRIETEASVARRRQAR